MPSGTAAAGEALRRIHELALSFEGELSRFWPPDEARRLVASSDVRHGLTPAEQKLVSEAVAQLIERLPERSAQPLHGDAHIWNTLQTRAGPRWLDFDEACRGPLEWDAATMIESDWVFGPRGDVRAAYAAAFGDRFDQRELAPWVELRVALIVLWLAVHAHGNPGERDELEHLLAWLRPRVA